MHAKRKTFVAHDLEIGFAVEIDVAVGFAVVGRVAEATLGREGDLRAVAQSDDRALRGSRSDLTELWRAPEHGPATDQRDRNRCRS